MKMTQLAKQYIGRIDDEINKTKTEIAVSSVGKQDPKRHLSHSVD